MHKDPLITKMIIEKKQKQKKLTHVKPRHPIASASMSPRSEGNEFRAGKYACM